MENNQTYCVIMAGGIGNRLWPVSTMQRPKQFLDLFGIGKSLFQMTVDRFRKIVPVENIVVVTNVLFRDVVQQQLPDFSKDQILYEPSRRNTAPAIAYAVTHIKGMVFEKVMGRPIGEDEQVDWSDPAFNVRIVISPSDHLIVQEDKFQQAMQTGIDFVTRRDALLTLGINPTRPEVSYGYIQMKSSTEQIKPVKTFTEKPNLELAKVFLMSGEFLWNSGIYLWNMRAILAELNRYMPDMMRMFQKAEAWMCTDQEETSIQQIFPACPNISIDYGVMEKSSNVYVLAADFDWSDLGTWGAVYDVSEKDATKNVTIQGDVTYSDSSGNIVCLPTGHAALIRGLNNYIVAQADHVIMVCPRWEEHIIDKEKSSVKSKNKV